MDASSARQFSGIHTNRIAAADCSCLFPGQFLPSIGKTDVEMAVALDSPMDTDMESATDCVTDVAMDCAMVTNNSEGAKKLGKKVRRRRRQNENMSRLVTPKNALMVLNEMSPGEGLVSQIKVVTAAKSPLQKQAQRFCASLNFKGMNYKGYGKSKAKARHVVAEYAFRDIVVQKINKKKMEGGAADDADTDSVPMTQLASFALHKLFDDWLCDGQKLPEFKIPQFKMAEINSSSSGDSDDEGVDNRQRDLVLALRNKRLPTNAASMHPSMLLSYMKPNLEFRLLSADGDGHQFIMFTMGVVVDGYTYCGRARNKKAARKAASKAACVSLWGVRFTENPTDLVPQTAA